MSSARRTPISQSGARQARRGRLQGRRSPSSARSPARTSPAARVLLAEAQIATGDYAGAEADDPAARPPTRTTSTAHLVLDQLRRLTGRSADARKDLEQLLKDHPDDRGVRTALAELRYDQGDTRRRQGAVRRRRSTSSTRKKLDLDDARPAVRSSPRPRATRRSTSSRTTRTAPRSRPTRQLTDAGIAWADLFSQKYAARARRADARGGVQGQPEPSRRARGDGRR